MTCGGEWRTVPRHVFFMDFHFHENRIQSNNIIAQQMNNASSESIVTIMELESVRLGCVRLSRSVFAIVVGWMFIFTSIVLTRRYSLLN